MGKGGSPLTGAEFQFCKMKRVLEMDCTTMTVPNTTELYTQEWDPMHISMDYIISWSSAILLSRMDIQLYTPCSSVWSFSFPASPEHLIFLTL